MKWFKRKPNASYVCPTCGQSHQGLPTDYGHLLPDVVWNEPVEVRKAHLDWSTDVCFYQSRWFIRGVIETPFQFQPERFGWGVWAEISEETMVRFRAHYEGAATHKSREPGLLANALHAHEDTLGLPLEIEFGPIEMRPLFFLPTDLNHPLAIEQQNGLNAERYHEILATMSHFNQ